MLDPAELGAGVDVDRGAGQHAELADPVEGACRQRRQSHHQVDDEEGEERDQPQREEVEGALPLDAGVDGLEPLAEARLDPVAQQKAADQKGQGGADGAGEGDRHQRRPEAEQGAAGQGHHRRAGQRQGGDGDVEEKIGGQGQQPVRRVVALKRLLARLELGQGQKALQIEGKEEPDQHGKDDENDDFFPATCHDDLPRGYEPDWQSYFSEQLAPQAKQE